MPATAQAIFERYVWTVMTRDADAAAELYASDGIYEAPLVPPGGVFPNRVQGREEILAFLTAVHQRMAGDQRKVNIERSRYVVHTTADPDVFIVELDTAFDVGDEIETMALVYI